MTKTATDPSVVRKPWASTSLRKFAAKLRNTLSCANRFHSRGGAAHRPAVGHTCPKGLRTAGIFVLPALNSGRTTAGNICACLCVSEWKAPLHLLQPLHLRRGFGFNLVGPELAAKRSQHEVVQLDAKLDAVLRARLQEAGNTVSWQDRLPSSKTT